MTRALPVLCLAILAAPLAAQKPKKPERDPAIAEAVTELRERLDHAPPERDGEIIESVHSLVAFVKDVEEAEAEAAEKGEEHPGMHPKDRVLIVEGLFDVYRLRRKPEDSRAFVATTDALGRVGGTLAASKLVLEFERDKKFDRDEWNTLRERMLENIGRTKDERRIEWLLDLTLQTPRDHFKRASGRALRHFEFLPFKKRRDIFDRLLVHYAKIEGDARRPRDSRDLVGAARARTLAAISSAYNQTLRAMTRGEQSFRTAREWQRFWNKNKKDPKAFGGLR